MHVGEVRIKKDVFGEPSRRFNDLTRETRFQDETTFLDRPVNNSRRTDFGSANTNPTPLRSTCGEPFGV